MKEGPPINTCFLLRLRGPLGPRPGGCVGVDVLGADDPEAAPGLFLQGVGSLLASLQGRLLAARGGGRRDASLHHQPGITLVWGEDTWK